MWDCRLEAGRLFAQHTNDKIGGFEVVRFDLKTFACCAQRRFGRIQTRKFRFVGCVDSGQLLAHKIRRLWFNMRCSCTSSPRMQFHISRSNDVRFKPRRTTNIQSRSCS